MVAVSNVAHPGRTPKAAGSGDLPSGEALSNLFVRETVVDDAEFETRPDTAVFALEFPEEVSVTDSDRLLVYGRRRVWTLKDISPAARGEGAADPTQVLIPCSVTCHAGCS